MVQINIQFMLGFAKNLIFLTLAPVVSVLEGRYIIQPHRNYDVMCDHVWHHISTQNVPRQNCV